MKLSRLQATSYKLQAQQGFTLMEIVVSTTIFAVVLTMTLAIFNYALKINRRTEALRQTTQGMRNFTEFLVKEIRNGKIEYSATPVSASCESFIIFL
jgi:prepilin-type N-terminal cleavage/methylation domain-containing protein